MTFDDYILLNLTCRFINIEKPGKLSLSVPCFFASPNLNVISVEVKPFKLKQGKYNLQFILNHEGDVK
jgi:hypothetical protein